MWNFFLIGQNKLSNRRSGYRYDSKSKISACGSHWRQSFHFQKILGGPNINVFCEKWHESSFYIEEQTQKNKLEIWVSKTTILDPQKSTLFAFEEKPPQKFVSSCFGFDSALKTIFNVRLVGFFENVKKVINYQIRYFGHFWQLITFFVCFKKYLLT